MVKNSFAKRLSVAVATALVASGLVVSPAQAAETLSLTPTAGTSYNTLTNSTFSFAVGFGAGSTDAALNYLKFKVTNNSAVVGGTKATFSAQVTKGTGNTTESAIAADASTTNVAASESAVVTASDVVIAPTEVGTDNKFAALGSATVFSIETGRLGADSSFTVQAFLDTNNNNVLDAGEDTSAARTVTFIDPSNVTVTAAFDPIAVGATSVRVVAQLSGDINYRQINAYAVALDFTSSIGGETDTTFTWNEDKAAFQATDGSITAATAEAEYVATVEIENDRRAGEMGTTVDYAEDVKATVKYETSATAAANLVSAKLVPAAGVYNEDTAITGSSQTGSLANESTGSGTVQKGLSSATFEIFIGTDAATPVGKSGLGVSVTVTASSAVTSDDLVKFNGKDSYYSKNQTFLLTTGETGVASFAITPASADDGDEFTVRVTAAGHEPIDYIVTIDEGTFKVDTVLSATAVSTVVGGSVSLDYIVYDQFGVAPANGKYSIVLTPTTQERATAASFTLVQPVVDGKASFNVVDNGKGTGKFTANAQLALNSALTGNSLEKDEVVVNVLADATATMIALETVTYGVAQKNLELATPVDNTKALLLSNVAYSSYDKRTALPTAKAPKVESSFSVTVGAKITNTSSAAVAGQPVTFAAKGILFKSGDRYSVDSISVLSNASGVASVEVHSNVGGAQSIVITSGALSTSQALTFESAGTTAATFELTVPATSEPGKTVDVKVLVKDKYSNPAKGVAVTLKSTGPGYLLDRTGTTDKDGYFTTKLLVGASEEGSAIVTATISIDDVETAKSATIAVEAASTQVDAIIGSFQGRWAVRVENAKGSTIAVKVGGNWYKYVALNDNYLFSRKSKVGAEVAVKVYVDGALYNEQTITVK